MELKNLPLKEIPLRYQATIVLEAKTPLVIGSGDKDLLLDNPIIRDAFDLPYIPATSLAGVLRHNLQHIFLPDGDKENPIIQSLFGFQDDKNDDGAGSRLIFSSAHLLGADRKVADGLAMANKMETDIKNWLIFPTRDHVRINHKGVADKDGHGKYESELLMRGVRFVFDLELWGNEADAKDWQAVLAAFSSPLFRIGAGTRKGFGQLEVLEIWQKTFDLRNTADFNDYLANTTQIELPTAKDGFKKLDKISAQSDKFIHYQLTLEARDFFLFDGQFDPEESQKANKANKKPTDMVQKSEQILTWPNDTPTLSKYKWLIPATSVKGAIAHRTAFNYNKSTRNFAKAESTDLLHEIQKYISQLNTAGLSEEETKNAKAQIAKYLDKLENYDAENLNVAEKNDAVSALFGRAAKEVDGKNAGQRGRVIFSDVYLDKPENTKVLNHVKIDRYTGGAMDTALFTEQVAATKEKFCLDIYVEKHAFEGDNNIQIALEQTLDELCREQLALGGGVMRGHGMMSGSFTIDDKPYNNQ